MSILIKLRKKVKAYEYLACGKKTKEVEKIVEDVAQDWAKWGDFKLWGALIVCNVYMLIDSISKDDLYNGLKLTAASIAFVSFVIFFLRWLEKTFIAYILIWGPIYFFIVMIKRSYKCLKKLFIRSAGA